jgi:hypothetical protein
MNSAFSWHTPKLSSLALWNTRVTVSQSWILLGTSPPCTTGWVVIWRCIRLEGHSRIDFFVVFPSEIRQVAGKQAWYRAKKIESGLSAVSLRPCGPLALIPVNGEENEIGGEIRTEKWLQCATLGSLGGDRSKWKLYFSRLYRPLSKCFT